MANGKPISLLPEPVGALERSRYEEGGYLSAKDLLTEQGYRLQRLWQHNRYLHGWGVVCGLQVVPAREPGRPWAVRVCPGYALGCCGEEIEVRSPVIKDIRDYLWNRFTDSGRPALIAYLGIRYSEEFANPVPAAQPICGCDETVYEYSRILDNYKVDVLWVLKDTFIPGFDVCARNVAHCPNCRESPCVLLARVTLPSSESDPITSTHIDNLSHRRHLATTTVVQQHQLIACCCESSGERDR